MRKKQEHRLTPKFLPWMIKEPHVETGLELKVRGAEVRMMNVVLNMFL